MDSASDFGSGGWGFESPLGLILFFSLSYDYLYVRFFTTFLTQGDVAHSVERSVRNRQAQGSKPCFSICFLAGAPMVYR